jgi:hypothetical protein
VSLFIFDQVIRIGAPKHERVVKNAISVQSGSCCRPACAGPVLHRQACAELMPDSRGARRGISRLQITRVIGRLIARSLFVALPVALPVN